METNTHSGKLRIVPAGDGVMIGINAFPATPEGIDLGMGGFEDSHHCPPSAEPRRNPLLLWLITLLF